MFVAGLNRLVGEWRAIAVPGATAKQGQSPAVDHEHTVCEVWYMRSQIRQLSGYAPKATYTKPCCEWTSSALG